MVMEAAGAYPQGGGYLPRWCVCSGDWCLDFFHVCGGCPGLFPSHFTLPRHVALLCFMRVLQLQALRSDLPGAGHHH